MNSKFEQKINSKLVRLKHGSEEVSSVLELSLSKKLLVPKLVLNCDSESNAVATDEGSQTCSSRKMTSLEKHLQLGKQSTTYMEQGKYIEAYGLLKTQHKLGPKVNFASVLIKYYVTLMQTERFEKADKIRDELCALLKEKFADSCEEVCEYAKRLVEEKKFIQAALFFQVSLHLAENEKHMPTFISLSQVISSGLRICCINLINESSINKQTARGYFIPNLLKIRCLAEENLTLDMKLSSLFQAVCWHNVECCQVVIGDLKQQEETLNKAINCIKRYHAGEASQFNIFGELLAHLGCNYMLTNRLSEGIKTLNQAIVAMKEACDFASSKEKADKIDELEKLLQLLQNL